MKNITIFTLYLLINKVLAVFAFPSLWIPFFSRIGLIPNSGQQQILETSLDDNQLLDLDDDQFSTNPIDLLVLNANEHPSCIVISNPMLFNQYIRDNKFINILFACPWTRAVNESKKVKSGTAETKQALVIETNYISIKEERAKQTNQLIGNTSQQKDLGNEDEPGNTKTSVQKDKLIVPLNTDSDANSVQSRNQSNLITHNENTDNLVKEDLTSENAVLWINAMEDARRFKCQKPIRPYIFRNQKGNSSNISYVVGFEIDMGKYDSVLLYRLEDASNERDKFFWTFTVVYRESEMRVVCVFHEVQYNEDTYSPEINESFENHNLGKKLMFSDIDIAQFYEIENQKTVFQNLFNDDDGWREYFDPEEEEVLVKVHLAPLHGFVTPTVRQSAKTYGNVAAMWKTIRNQAWRKVEDYINILSHVLINIIVITGTYETLELNGKKIFLADEKLPVPLAFWKLVTYGLQSPVSQGILIVTINNPYQDIGNTICKIDECEKYGWEYIQEKDYTKGRTICCEFTNELLSDIYHLDHSRPEKVLNLNDSSKMDEMVHRAWEFDKDGVRTTSEQRKLILNKLKPKRRFINKEKIG